MLVMEMRQGVLMMTDVDDSKLRRGTWTKQRRIAEPNEEATSRRQSYAPVFCGEAVWFVGRCRGKANQSLATGVRDVSSRP